MPLSLKTPLGIPVVYFTKNKKWVNTFFGGGYYLNKLNKNKLIKISWKWIKSKVLLHSTENYIQYPVINPNGKEY